MDTMQVTIINARPLYYSWGIFKRDLELNLGHFVPYSLWLQFKPKKPLPWSNLDLKETISHLTNLEVILNN